MLRGIGVARFGAWGPSGFRRLLKPAYLVKKGREIAHSNKSSIAHLIMPGSSFVWNNKDAINARCNESFPSGNSTVFLTQPEKTRLCKSCVRSVQTALNGYIRDLKHPIECCLDKMGVRPNQNKKVTELWSHVSYSEGAAPGLYIFSFEMFEQVWDVEVRILDLDRWVWGFGDAYADAWIAKQMVDHAKEQHLAPQSVVDQWTDDLEIPLFEE